MSFQNSSYYILPLSFESGESLKKKLDPRIWECVTPDRLSCNYLFEYVSQVVKNEEFCAVYTVRLPSELPVYFFEKELDFSSSPTLDQVNLYLFSTGVAFLEYYVNYHEMTVEEIIRFAYLFKSTGRADRHNYDLGDKKSLLTISKELLPEKELGVEFFFGNNSAYKRQSFCFHMIQSDYENDYERDRLLFYLKRSYNIDFAYGQANDCGKYDMVYAPYDYMVFGGSQEGFVALCRPTDLYFMEKYFFPQLKNDYRYMYLILLNQRLSEIKYIEEIAFTEDTVELVESLSRKIVHLKTRFSFHVVSDDFIYQNIYAKLYEILDIDKLFLDIEENGDRLALAQSNDSVSREKKTNDFLMYISILSVISAVTDLASYLDRTSLASIIATIASLASVVAFVILGVCRTFRKPFNKKKKKKDKQNYDVMQCR